MTTLSLAEAAAQLAELHDQLINNGPMEAATITDDGKPVLAVLPWEWYTSLLAIVQLPTNLHELVAAPPEVRDFVLQLAAERAAPFYVNDPDLTDFEAFDEEDYYDSTE
jgi:hypothetical protein